MKKSTIAVSSIVLVAFLCSSNIIAVSTTEFDHSLFPMSLNSFAPPYPASNPMPANNSTNVDTHISLSWVGGDPDGDPVTYNIFFGTNTTPPYVQVVYPYNEYNPGPLVYNTKYYWRIDTYTNNGDATTGPLWSFTTREDMAPNAPYGPYPADNATDIPRNVTLSWDCTDPDGDSLNYTVYFGTDINPPSVVSGLNTTQYNVGFQQYYTVYYWRVVAFDYYGYNTTGPLWSFTTKNNSAPYAASNPIPSNNSTDVSIDLTVFWSGGDPDNDSVTYNLYFGINATPPLTVEHLNATNFTLARLNFSSTYFWRIDTIDEYGLHTTGAVWTFTTRPNAAPYAPTDPIPPNGSTNIYIDAIFSWQHAGDPDNDTVTFDVYFGIDPNPPKVASNISILSYNPGDMNITTEYYWRIVAWDNHSNNVSSPIWSFITSVYKNSPPDQPSIPDGPLTGKRGRSYSFTSTTNDSNGEPMYYKWSWDDGTETPWLGPYNSGQTATASHIWDTKGTYAIKVKAKDFYGGESFWSEPFTIRITIKLSQSIPPYYEMLFQRFPFLYAVLGYLLGY